MTPPPGFLFIGPYMVPKRKRPTIAQVKARVARKYRRSVEDFSGRDKRREATEPRNVAIYLACRLTARTLNEIGRSFGGRHHTTILAARRVVEARRREDPALAADIRTMLGGVE